MRFPAMNESYTFWQGWTLVLKIMNILALYVLKISGSFRKSGKNALRIYPPPKKKGLLRPWLPYGLNFFFRSKLYKNQYRKITFLPLDKKAKLKPKVQTFFQPKITKDKIDKSK